MNRIRPYQKDAADAAFHEWETVQSTLIVCPTGVGKTRIASEIIRRMLPKRSMFIAHRYELVSQAFHAIERDAEVKCEIEMAEESASTNLFCHTPVVVASIQTLCAGGNGGRMARFNPTDFGLLIFDEAHHGTSQTYRRVIEYFKKNPEIKILGLTATPDRLDEEALGQIFETVAFEYEMTDAISDGWLTPIQQQMVKISSLDYSQVRTTAGDLNGADLSKVMEDEKNLQGMVGSSIEIIGMRKSIAFASSVKHAEQCCEIFNRHRPNMAGWICGETPKEERRVILQDFKDGKIQVLCNVGIATEGFDSPDTEVIIMGRPTKSRALYQQCIGRGTRPLAGILDDLHSAYERREEIKISQKPVVTVLDFCGNSGKHKLITTADILGGKYSDQVIERANKKSKETDKPVRMDELLKKSEEELKQEQEEIRRRIRAAEEARKAESGLKSNIVAKVKFRVTVVDPFDAFDIRPQQERGWDHGKQLSMKQRGVLFKIGVDPDKLDYVQGKQLLNEQFRRWKNNLATLGQCKLLKRNGYETKDMTMKKASELIDCLAKNGWKRLPEYEIQNEKNH